MSDSDSEVYPDSIVYPEDVNMRKLTVKMARECLKKYKSSAPISGLFAQEFEGGKRVVITDFDKACVSFSDQQDVVLTFDASTIRLKSLKTESHKEEWLRYEAVFLHRGTNEEEEKWNFVEKPIAIGFYVSASDWHGDVPELPECKSFVRQPLS